MFRRRATPVVAFLLVVAACATDSPEDGDPPPSTTSTTSTTATEVPELLLECPRPVDPLATADMDGDGLDEVLTVEEVDDGQQFVACGSDGGRAIALGLGVWYLAVFDVEPDGTDEVFLGGPKLRDLSGSPSVSLRWMDPRGPALQPYTENLAELRVGGSGGAGCVDVDGDGSRELVSTWIDTESSTADEVVWHREVASARPFEGDPDPIEGVFRVGVDDARIALLSRLSCGEDLVELVRVAPPASICDGRGRSIDVDVDGDRLDDRVHQRDTNAFENFEGSEYGGPSIAVCTAAGQNDEVRVRGMGEIFAASDATGDRPTIWSGGTTAANVSYHPMVWIDGRIVPITDDDGPIYFDSGWFGNDQRMAFGCADLNDDGIVELVQFDGVRDGAEMVWTRRSWETVADQAELVTESSGRLPWPEWPEGEFTGELPVEFDDLAVSDEACGWVDEKA